MSKRKHSLVQQYMDVLALRSEITALTDLGKEILRNTEYARFKDLSEYDLKTYDHYLYNLRLVVKNVRAKLRLLKAESKK